MKAEYDRKSKHKDCLVIERRNAWERAYSVYNNLNEVKWVEFRADMLVCCILRRLLHA